MKLLNPYADAIQFKLFTKADGVVTDAQAATALNATKSAGLHQVHGGNIVIVRDQVNRDIQADGMVTDQNGLALCIRWADCQNFLFYAPEQGVLGVLHTGWPGLLRGALYNFFSTVNQEWNISPEELLVYAGPSLCQQCADFTDPIRELPSVNPEFIDGRCADLQGIAEDRLRRMGVPDENFERHPDCTRCHPETYWTYRGGDRDAVKSGSVNMLAAVLT